LFRSGATGEPADGLAVDEPGVPVVTAASWRTAETQLFAALTGSPDVYQGVVLQVGATVNRLRRLGPSTSALLDAATTITALVGEVIKEGGLSADAVDPDLVGRAALALRHREVVGELAVARRLGLLAAARAKGTAWVVVEEAGGWAGDPLLPYRRLEVEAATGRALLVTATPDDDFRTSRHAVEVLHVDLDSGRVEGPRGPAGEPSWQPSATDREAQVTALRERLASSG